jgi:hypothetical protein
MQPNLRTRRTILGGAFGAGVAAVVVSALTLFAGAGVAAGAAAPVNTSPPTISGTPAEGDTLTGDRGQWSNGVDTYNYVWQRCDRNGSSCANITGADTRKYTLTSADVNTTLRFKVRATNSSGSTTATSVPTAVIQKKTPTPPPTPSGCPSGNPKQVNQMSLPAKLVIDQFQANPSVLTSGTQSFVLRVHVTSTCGGDVQGALVYGTATPFNQFTVSEQPTDATGWATLTLNRLTNYPVNHNQGILAMFLRARKSGENVLAGITGYRLVSVDVNLHS